MEMPVFEFAHVGINRASETEALDASNTLGILFGWAATNGRSSIFAGPRIELTKSPFPGDHGHIGIATPDIEKALEWLDGQGVKVLPGTQKKRDGELIAVYLDLAVSGFAIHLLKA